MNKMDLSTIEYKNRIEISKQKIETEISITAAENAELIRKIEIGKEAEGKLHKNRARLRQLMNTYLGMEV